MEKNFVLNGNKLIAEFMELISVDNNDDQIWYQVDDEYILNSEFRYKNNIQYTTVDMLPYNVSWDWLIPVVEKICKLLNNNHASEYDDYEDFYIIFNEFSFINNNFEELYTNVVEFIKWYNKNKNKEMKKQT